MRAPHDNERWFIMPMQSWPEESRRTVLAGKPIGANRLVAVFDTAEEAEAAVREHNASLNENGPASAATDPDLDPANLEKGQAMDALENTTTPAAPATVPLPYWLAAMLQGQPLTAPFEDGELPSEFEHVRHEVSERVRDEGGAPIGGYEVVGEFWTIERRKAVA